MERDSRDRLFEQTVASTWREERVSCPHPDLLRAFLEGSLEAGPAGFLRFHLEQAACPWCTARAAEFAADRGGPPAAVETGVVERTLRSTLLGLRKR